VATPHSAILDPCFDAGVRFGSGDIDSAVRSNPTLVHRPPMMPPATDCARVARLDPSPQSIK